MFRPIAAIFMFSWLIFTSPLVFLHTTGMTQLRIIIPHLYVWQSSWRWTLVFETWRKLQKMKN